MRIQLTSIHWAALGDATRIQCEYLLSLQYFCSFLCMNHINICIHFIIYSIQVFMWKRRIEKFRTHPSSQSQRMFLTTIILLYLYTKVKVKETIHWNEHNKTISITFWQILDSIKWMNEWIIIVCNRGANRAWNTWIFRYWSCQSFNRKEKNAIYFAAWNTAYEH